MASVVSSVFTGLFFRYYPARKAPVLNPAGALSHEWVAVLVPGHPAV